MDEILWCDHSNESSLPVLSHGAICLLENEICKFGRNLPLATCGSERVKRRQISLTSLRSTVTEKLFSSSDTSDAFDPLWMPFTISTVLPENPFTSFASKYFVTSCDNLLL